MLDATSKELLKGGTTLLHKRSVEVTSSGFAWERRDDYVCEASFKLCLQPNKVAIPSNDRGWGTGSSPFKFSCGGDRVYDVLGGKRSLLSGFPDSSTFVDETSDIPRNFQDPSTG